MKAGQLLSWVAILALCMFSHSSLFAQERSLEEWRERAQQIGKQMQTEKEKPRFDFEEWQRQQARKDLASALNDQVSALQDLSGNIENLESTLGHLSNAIEELDRSVQDQTPAIIGLRVAMFRQEQLTQRQSSAVFWAGWIIGIGLALGGAGMGTGLYFGLKRISS